MNEERREKLSRRRKAYVDALAAIEKAMANILEARIALRDQPFIDEANSDLDKARNRLREAQKNFIVAVYDVDKEIDAETGK